MLDWILCRLGKCRRCSQYETDEGIGGKCDNCGRIHGWVTREALRKYLDWQERQRTFAAINAMTVLPTTRRF